MTILKCHLWFYKFWLVLNEGRSITVTVLKTNQGLRCYRKETVGAQNLRWIHIYLIMIVYLIIDIAGMGYFLTDSLVSRNQAKPYDHQTFKCSFCTHTLKLSNQKKVFIRYSILIGWLSMSTRTNLCSKVFWP